MHFSNNHCSGSVTKQSHSHPERKLKIDTQSVKLSETVVANAVNKHEFNLDSVYMRCKTIIAASSDVCPPSSWVFYKPSVMVVLKLILYFLSSTDDFILRITH